MTTGEPNHKFVWSTNCKFPVAVFSIFVSVDTSISQKYLCKQICGEVTASYRLGNRFAKATVFIFGPGPMRDGWTDGQHTRQHDAQSHVIPPQRPESNCHRTFLLFQERRERGSAISKVMREMPMAKWFFLHTFFHFRLLLSEPNGSRVESSSKRKKKKLGQIEKCLYGRPQQSTCKSASFPYRIFKKYFFFV